MNFPSQTCYGGIRVVDRPSPDNVRRLDMGAMPCIARMQSNGLLVDKAKLRELSVFLGQEKERHTERVRELTGYYINVGSPDQIEALLFKKVGLAVPKHFQLTESGNRYVVDDEALSSIKHLHAVIPVIQAFTECHKIKSSYADKLGLLADPKTGRVHTTLGPTRQVSGRISSSKPNLMAQPVRTKIGRMLRACYIAGKGKKLGTIDQSNIEMRFAAHLSGCISMIDTFIREGDVHVETAVRIFFPDWPVKLGRMPNKKEAKAMGMDDMRHRYPAKRIGFGILMGITDEGLLDQILVADDPDNPWSDEERDSFRAEWTLAKCGATIAQWYGEYWEIRSYMDGEFSLARKRGHVHDLFGRIRLCPGVKSVHKRIVAETLRGVGAFKISASATGSMKLFLAKCFNELVEKKFRGKLEPLLSIHDECLMEFDEDIEQEWAHECKVAMENIIRLDVPVRCGIATGYDWAGLEK